MNSIPLLPSDSIVQGSFRIKGLPADAGLRAAQDEPRFLPSGGLTPDTSLRIVHHMVNYKESRLDRTFAALMDRTRREILA